MALALIVSTSTAIAEESATLIQEKAAQFLLQKDDSSKMISTFKLNGLRNGCEPEEYSGSCVQYVAGNYASSDEKLQAVRACVGNRGDGCAKYVAGPYAGTSERIAAAKACQNAELECVKFTAGAYAGASEKIAAAKACGGN